MDAETSGKLLAENCSLSQHVQSRMLREVVEANICSLQWDVVHSPSSSSTCKCNSVLLSLCQNTGLSMTGKV